MKKLFIGSLAVLGVVYLLGVGVLLSRPAGESSQPDSVGSIQNLNPNATTTTQVYMTAGTATTTLMSRAEQAESIAISALIVSSTTQPSLRWRYECSENGVDWYAIVAPLNVNATTTNMTGDFSEYSFVATASSTAGTSQKVGANTRYFIHSQPVSIACTYARGVFYVPAGAPAINGAFDLVLQGVGDTR